MLLLHLRIYTSPHIWLLLSFLVLTKEALYRVLHCDVPINYDGNKGIYEI